jgi:hypothetical protein
LSWVRSRLVRGPSGYEVLDLELPADVVVYFGDDTSRLYQLDQWLPALEQLAARRPVALLMRSASAARDLVGRTSLPIVYVRTLRQLMDLYGTNDFKVALYVNHSRINFQSLLAADMLHVHVNHGESDKRSSFSNQVRAYNRVFVAGANAAARYRERLLELDDASIVEVGRPQLDVRHDAVLPPSTLRTLAYAPTWEGDLEDNNWTSLDVYGPDVVRALLDVADSQVVYKPHPRVATTTSAAVAEADRAVRRILERAAAQHPGRGHAVLPDAEILGLLPQCDALVTDVSTVALDFLYLAPDRPLFLTDRRNDREQLAAETPLADGVDVVDRSTLPGLGKLVSDRLLADARRTDREAMRRRYFGDIRLGESTPRFVAAVDSLCEERDRLVLARGGRPSAGSADIRQVRA